MLQCTTCMQLSCVRMRTLVRCRVGGGKKIAIVIAFLEDGGLAGGQLLL